jgi:hypothetical protein
MFSIIVPCTDREVNYLENCLKGLLLQSYKRFEIVVILNLKKKITDFDIIINKFKKEKKIKFFYNNKFLKINENYEEALNLTKRKWVIYCSADDCLVSESLWIIREIIKKKNAKLICYNYQGLSYNHDNNNFYFNKNNFNKDICYYSVKTIDVLNNIIKNDMIVSSQKKILPFIPRTVFHKSIINSKKIFGKSEPMSHSGIYNLTIVDSYYYIDRQFLIFGIGKNSLSATHNNNFLFTKIKKNKSDSADLYVEYAIVKKIFYYLKEFPFYSSNRMIHLGILFYFFKNLPNKNKIKLFFFNKFNKWKKNNHSNFLLSVFVEFQNRKNNFFINLILIKALYKINTLFSFLKFFYFLIIFFIRANLLRIKIKFTKNFINLDNIFVAVKFIRKNFNKSNLSITYKGDYFEKNSTYR